MAPRGILALPIRRARIRTGGAVARGAVRRSVARPSAGDRAVAAGRRRDPRRIRGDAQHVPADCSAGTNGAREIVVTFRSSVGFGLGASLVATAGALVLLPWLSG